MIDNPSEWFQMKINELQSGLKRKEILLEMKSLVLNSEKSVLNDIAQHVSLHQLFECLNSTNKQEVEFICVVIYELLNQLSQNELVDTYGDCIQKALIHNFDEVKKISLKLLEKSISQHTIENINKKLPSLFIDAARCLASDERGTAQCAISVFTKMGCNPEGISVLYSKFLVQKLKEIMLINDTSRFRIYEIIVNVSKMSPENLAASKEFLNSLVSEINSSDVLIQLNAFEILSSLANCNHGLNYLIECSVVQELVDKLLKINDEPLSFMLLPGLIEFFGNVCVQQPENFVKEFPQVMNLLFNSINTDDQTLLGVILSTVGKVGSSCSGRIVLMQFNEQIMEFFNRISKLLTSKNDLTISALNSLSQILKKINGNSSCNEITESWFNAMGPSTFDRIVSFTKLPFPEFKLSAYSLLISLTTHQWGVIKLANYPGMIEFLLDRSSEINKDCKQMKYEIIQKIAGFPNIELTLAPEVLQNLREFVREGPFYVPVDIELATEGAL